MSSDVKETLRGLALAVFLVVVVLPIAFRLTLWTLNPNRTLEGWTHIFEDAIVPWWVGIAGAAPLVFVGLVLFLGWIDAEEML